MSLGTILHACFSVGAKQSTRCGVLAWQKSRKRKRNTELCFGVVGPGFLNQWAIGHFAVGHRAIRKIGCYWFKKVLFHLYLEENWQKSRTPMSWPFFRIRAKIALPEVKTSFFWSSKQNNDLKMETSFFEAESHRAMVQQRWPRKQWATQTFKKYKMVHGFENVENHWVRQKQSAWFIRTNQ